MSKDEPKSMRRSMTKRQSVIDILENGATSVTTADGSKYTGGWKDDRFHGKGEFHGSDGTHYFGEYVDGVMQGKGTLKTKAGTFEGVDGSRYNGSFEHGERVGVGTLIFPDSGKYVGPFVANLQHGEGEYSGPVYSYSGEYRSGMKHGGGVMIFKSGNKYEGQFVNDLMHGRGTFTGADGHVYTGDFVEGALHGSGVYTSKDGSVYEGKFENNHRQGQGTLKLADGSTYIGGLEKEREFEIVNSSSKAGKMEISMNGARHGPGKLTFADGVEYVGEFNQGRPVGGGDCKFPDGTTTKLVIPVEFQKFFGPQSNPLGWEIALLKILTHWKISQDEKMGKAPAEETFGFDEEPVAAAQAAPEPVPDDGDEWEEVEVDEFGNPIEHTARPISSK